MEYFALWTIYDHPEDYPEHYVARKWIIADGKEKATDHYLIDTDLNTLRRRLPPSLYCMPRQEKDDPVIVETWV